MNNLSVYPMILVPGYAMMGGPRPSREQRRELKYCEACTMPFIRCIEVRVITSDLGKQVEIEIASVICGRCVGKGATQHSEFKAPPTRPKEEQAFQVRRDEEHRYRRRGAAQPRSETNRSRETRSRTSYKLDIVSAKIKEKGSLTAAEINAIMGWSRSFCAAHHACKQLGLVTVGFTDSGNSRGKKKVCLYGFRPENYSAPVYRV